MTFKKTTLEGLYIVETPFIYDDRGYFLKTFNYNTFSQIDIAFDVKESFQSVSRKGALRGLHFQVPPKEHYKLVQCVSGIIQDVVVDLRKNSPTFKQVYSTILCGENARGVNSSILISPGFAHGFKTVSEWATVNYMTSCEYDPYCDKGILWNSIPFEWGKQEPILSDRDKSFPTLEEFESPF